MIGSNLTELAEALLSAQNILLFPHMGIDGDCVGSTFSLCEVLRNMGKNVHALYNEELPGNIKFMSNDSKGRPIFTDNEDIIADELLDICMCIDNGDYARFADFREKFDKAPLTLCLDHHSSSIMRDESGAEYGIAKLSYIDPQASATGELMFDLVKEINRIWTERGNETLIPNKKIGEAIFVALTTDTGNFQYSNTNKHTHEIMAELYDWDIDFAQISVDLYENERKEAIDIRGRAMARMEIIAGGNGAISYVTKKDLDEFNILPGETDPIIRSMRLVSGVEYAAFLKEKSENVIRVSLRAKSVGNVEKIAVKHKGGGHKKAAGCTLYMPIEEAVSLISADIEEAVGELKQ